MTHPLRIGFFAIGLDRYWEQFAGLRERILGYCQVVQGRLARPGVEIVDLGLIDTPEKAGEAGHAARRGDVDLLVLYVPTYALSHTVLPVVQRARVPVLILNLQPGQAMDYAAFNRQGDRVRMTGDWLAWCSACPVPEIANVFNRARIPFHQVTGCLEAADPCWQEVDAWMEAARVASVMAHNRCGLMGHYYNGMMDVYSDLTQQVAAFGGHFEIVEVEELVDLRRSITQADIAVRVADFGRTFELLPGCAPAELERAARTSLALDRLVAAHRLGSMTYYHEGSGIPDAVDAMSSVILGTSLLTARGIPCCGEYEVKNIQAMKILDAFGIGGSFSEYVTLDLKDDVVLWGHDGPGHIAISEGRTKVRPLDVYHGKIGLGLSVEMSVRNGPVTLLSVVQRVDGRLELLVAEGESVPGPVLEIGNTNSRYRFPCGARRFTEGWNARGPAHHCAIGVGHAADRIRKLGSLLGIETVQVC